MSLSETLKSLLQMHQLTESELARKTGISQPIIHGIVSGKNQNPKIATLAPLTEFFCLNMSQLLGEIPLGEKHSLTADLATVPIYPWNFLSENVAPTRNTIADVKISSNAFALEIMDKSMEPRFGKGTIIIVEPNQKPRSEDFVLAKIQKNPMPIFRQYFINEEERELLISINPFEKMNMHFLEKKDSILGVIIQSKINLI
jgi:transcriptional regulator with XRE-family HTH domain